MPKKDRVSIIQGSGSGHEPAHTMIVGPGMLDAACPGDVFAGPPVEFVTETSKLMDTPAGVLYIVNNYTGDRTAWEMAKELQEAEGQKIGYLLVNDDVAVKDSTWTIGRRGVAGNFFVIKAVAAKADKGGTLEECVAVGEKVIANVRTMGIALIVLHAAGPRHAALRDRRRRDGSRHRHPRRAGPPARPEARAATEIVDILLDAIVPDLPFVARRRGRGHGQRPRRNADQRAVPAVRHRPQEARREGHQGLPQLRRRVLHVARDGRRAHLRSSRSTTSSRSSSSPRPRSPTGCSDPPYRVAPPPGGGATMISRTPRRQRRAPTPVAPAAACPGPGRRVGRGIWAIGPSGAPGERRRAGTPSPGQRGAASPWTSVGRALRSTTHSALAAGPPARILRSAPHFVHGGPDHARILRRTDENRPRRGPKLLGVEFNANDPPGGRSAGPGRSAGRAGRSAGPGSECGPRAGVRAPGRSAGRGPRGVGGRSSTRGR